MPFRHEDIFAKLGILGRKDEPSPRSSSAVAIAEAELLARINFERMARAEDAIQKELADAFTLAGKWPPVDAGWDAMGKSIPGPPPVPGAMSSGPSNIDPAKPKPIPWDLNVAANRMAMICMRLHCKVDEFPFKHFTTIFANDKVYVTLVMGNEAVMFTDPAEEFPSDTLMAQLRLVAP